MTCKQTPVKMVRGFTLCYTRDVATYNNVDEHFAEDMARNHTNSRKSELGDIACDSIEVGGLNSEIFSFEVHAAKSTRSKSW